MKKVIRVLLAIALVMAIAAPLAGCSKEKSDDTLKLMVYAPANNAAKQVYRQMIADFTEETGIKVNINFVPKDNYNTKLKTSFRTKDNAPDVFYLDQPTLADYFSRSTNHLHSNQQAFEAL